MLLRYSDDKLLRFLAYFYVMMVMVFTKIGIDFNYMLFFIYLLLALPFYKKTEYYISICVLLSTISYYFIGAYEHVMSIYTILMLISTISFIMSGENLKINTSSIIYTGLLCLNIYISYNKSEQSYLFGFLRLVYIVSVFYYIFTIKRINLEIITRFLPKLGCLMVFCESIIALSNADLSNITRLRIAQDVNANTFAMSCAIITGFLGISISNGGLSKLEFLLYRIAMMMSFILLILTGSRTALMAFILAYSVTLFIKARREHRIHGYVSKFVISVIVLLAIVYAVVSMFGLDISRYDYVTAVAGGGTNRAAIYEKLIPYIINNDYYIWGYGPGHDTTKGILQTLVYRSYSHSHNTFLEAFGELGVVGLILTVLYVITALKKISQYCKLNSNGYVLMVIIISMLVNSMGESYFCYAVFWLMLNMIIHNVNLKEKTGK